MKQKKNKGRGAFAAGAEYLYCIDLLLLRQKN
jgi:hypothetical protein